MKRFFELIKERFHASREILWNVFWLFADKIFRQGLNFLLTAYIAKYLGAESFGLWNYAIALVVIFSFFSTLGIYSQLSRDLIKFPERKNELLGNAFIIKFIGSGVTILVSYLIIVVLKPGAQDIHFLVFIVGLGYIFQAFDVLDYFFQTQLKSQWIAIARIGSFIVFATLKLLFVYLKYPLVYFVWLQSGEYFLATIIFVWIYNNFFGKISNWVINWDSARKMLREGLPIIFSEIAILIYMKIDQIMVGEIIGNKGLGIFSAAVRLSEITYFIPVVICSSLFPSIIRTHANNIQQYRYKLQQLYDLLVGISISLVIFISLFSNYIVVMIYGNEFIEASSVLVVHIWTCLFVYVGFASGQQLVVENLIPLGLYRTLVGVVINIILNFIFIPMWGIIGGALSTLVTQIFVSWISLYFHKKTQNMFWMILNSFNPLRLFKVYILRLN